MLSAQSREIVTATLPVVREHVVAIATRFYGRMLGENPELLNVFNRGNQASGEQRKALAGSVVAYAAHLVGQGQEIPLDAVISRIAHKHVSLGITPEQYTIVGRYLMGAVKEVLGEAVTPEVAAAWDEVYWLFAVKLIAIETRMYQDLHADPGRIYAPWVVTGRVEEAEDAVSLLLAPESGPVPHHLAGQYVTVALEMADGVRQGRQYTVSRAAGHEALRITVRRVRGTDGTPDGEVSTLLTTTTKVGDQVWVTPPVGDIALAEGAGPVVLASAGIGVTPMMAMLEHLAERSPDRPVAFVHADRSPARHALAQEAQRLGGRLESFTSTLFYEQDAPEGARAGLVDPDAVPAYPDADFYLCGPLPFMRDVRTSLLRRGVDTGRIRFEVFGSDLWTSGADRLPVPEQAAS
ncbi:globin domain-containing protein [Actinosynnema mirum]|uniref:nitric oxide dioxygenase n=1 Tax=Actinosynnema mirum (strain ATCC 29888 / DSM 43827 / JCM 3225 / NBRC 14064 / NCIMB 13271 / NRRL B-12336 / IMRU 3971 / 101) TaxID=446462 RepID=C6WD65_ACTMD|nr:globin domain-containing protein [Actinosynnema mirum]ACU37684.1 oxidoreductase FAD/NAD(P)-binding domain protein [Actinosynnema mirum DSM 43827]